jgi:hypothetical protein
MTKPTQTQVRRMTEWETEADEALQLPAVRNAKNFVAPLPVSQPATWQPAQPHELQAQHSVAQVVSVATSHWDRAKGFSIKTLSLAAVIGALSVIVAIAGFNVPLLSLPILLWFGTGFGAVWLVAYIWSEATSPDGAMLFQIFGSYRLTRNEQKFRQEYIRHINGMPQPDERKRKGRK